MNKQTDVALTFREQLGVEWLPTIYERRVRTQRTRAFRLNVARRENRADIQHTLLGIELKVGRKRFTCPDLATARFLRVFARIGCTEFAIPYDITRISPIADELETSWQRSLIVMGTEPFNPHRSKLIKVMRDEIASIGPGEPMPLFDRETRQRK